MASVQIVCYTCFLERWVKGDFSVLSLIISVVRLLADLISVSLHVCQYYPSCCFCRAQDTKLWAVVLSITLPSIGHSWPFCICNVTEFVSPLRVLPNPPNSQAFMKIFSNPIMLLPVSTVFCKFCYLWFCYNFFIYFSPKGCIPQFSSWDTCI